jgi:hypothetical protein
MLSKSKNETPRQAFDKAEAEGDSVSNLNIISAIELKSGGRIKAALDVADAPPADVIAVDPEFEKADDLLSDLDMTPALEAESDAEIMAALDSSDAIDPRDYATAPNPVAPVLTIKKPAPPPSAMADISDDEIGRGLEWDDDLESDPDLDLGAEIILDLEADLDPSDPADALAPVPDALAAPDAGKTSTVKVDLPVEPVADIGDLDYSDEAAIERLIEADDIAAPDPVRSKITKKHIDEWRTAKRRKRGWSALSVRERAAKSDPGELLKARKERNQAEHRAKAGRPKGVKSRAEYLAAEASRVKPWEAAGCSRRTWYRRITAAR